MPGRRVANLETLLEDMARRNYEWHRKESFPEWLPWAELDEMDRKRHRKAIRVAVFDYLKDMDLSIAYRPTYHQEVAVEGLEET